MKEQAQNGTLVQQVASGSPQNFRELLNDAWQSIEAVKDTIAEQVEAGAIPPITALGMISCVTGQTFGYQAFHGQVTPADLLASVSDAGRLALSRS